MAPLNQFLQQLDRIAETTIPGVVLDATKALALAAHEGPLDANRPHIPYRTGHAIASWHLGVGAPDDSLPLDVTERSPISREEAVARARDTQTRLVAARPYEPIFASSDVDYMPDLEAGTSVQAPAGFVGPLHAELEVLTGQEIVNAAVPRSIV